MSLKSVFQRYSIAILFLLLSFLNGKSQFASNQENYDVKLYFLDLKVTDTSTIIEGSARIDIQLLNNPDTIVFDLGSLLNVSKVTINGEEAGFSHLGDILTVFSSGLEASQLTSIVIYYNGNGDDDNGYGAIFNRTNDYGRFTYSLTEPFSSKYWFPCKEVLADKADSVYIYLTVPENLKAGSNGLLVATEHLGNGWVKYKWQSRYPVSFYLISMAVGNYRDYSFKTKLNDTIPEMPVVNYIYNSDKYFDDSKEDIDMTDTLLRLYSGLFGIYPFYKEKYGHCVAPIGGGMEHQTMTTLVNFDFELVAHEMAHQWFGDYVTCKYWNDIWLNEGFASYCEFISLEKLKGETAAKSWMDNAQNLVMSIPDGSVYVPESMANNDDRLFDSRLSYKKGAAILHILRFELNDDNLFFNILREYLKKYSFGTATGEDFKAVVEQLSGRNFDDFFNEWYYGEGYPEIEASWFQMNDTVYISSYETTSIPELVDFFHLKLQFKLVTPMFDTIVEFRQNSKDEIFKLYLPNVVYNVKVDPKNYLLLKGVVQQNTDTAKVLQKNLLLFPNPVNDKLNLFSQTISIPVELIITNENGVIVKKINNVSPYRGTVSLGDLEKGIYLLRVMSREIDEIHKVVKD
jgi:aminopeptidase N